PLIARSRLSTTLCRRFVFATVQPAFAQGRFRTFLETRGVAPALRDKLIERIADLNKTIADDARNLGPGYVIGHSYFASAIRRTRTTMLGTRGSCTMRSSLAQGVLGRVS